MPKTRALLIGAAVCSAFVLCATGAVVGSARVIERAAQGRVYSDSRLVPHRKVAVVLGCSPTVGGGYTNPFFVTRIQAAAELFRLGKADYLLVSGDNRRHDYDEPSAMKDALVAAGVPQDRIYCDYAGRRTLDSVVRAREVFGQNQIIVVSQDFHNQRAIFIAQHRGVDAVGFNAPDVDRYSAQSVLWREQLARVKAVAEVYVVRRQPHFLGARVQIGEQR